MSGPFGSSQWMYSTGAGGFYPYSIGQSLRFNDDDSAYLTRTPASAGNQRKLTWSTWVKRSAISNSISPLLGVFPGGSNSFILFYYNDDLFIYNSVSGVDYGYDYSDKFRDSAAWYHVLLKVDTAQATTADRVVLYVNNRRITSVATSYGDFPQNYDLWLNSAQPHYIGRRVDSSSYFDGYMAEVNFIDGLALDPTSFGELKSGVWVPKEYTGSYGTNGFYLNFSDSAAIGDDLSGNANDWTPTNLASTDVLLDSPTNNFCTLSTLAPSTLALSEGNLKFTGSSAGAYRAFGNTAIPSSGKWYFECYIGSATAQLTECGIGQMDNGYPIGAKLRTYRSTGEKYGTSFVAYGATYTTGDVIGVAVDIDAGEIEFFKNNVSQGVAWTDLGDAEWHPIVLEPGGGTIGIITTNFGQDSSFAGNKTAQGNTDANGVGDFYYAPPADYLALCTANLPAPAIDPAEDDVPADYFNTVLYTGTGASQSITGVGFQPDFLWLKNRGAAGSHHLYDAQRGAALALFSDATSAENSRPNSLTSFDTDGFTVGTSSDGNTNLSSNSYVAWNWLAGNGTSSNTDGSITSTVSVNQKAGFSIVGYTGNGTNPGATIGHGLGVVPDLIITRARSATGEWPSYHSALPISNTVYLYATYASATYVNRFSAVSSSTFTTGSSGVELNASGVTYIAYCFAGVEGFSKFGSYTGNGSADGPFVYCGFRPAFVMVKRTNTTGNWTILDNSREGYNVDNDPLYPNLSNAEGTTDLSDLLSNGFKLRSTDASVNASGGTYIFAAFAQQPVKFSNAR
jgi:hypothetical protein